MHPKTHFSWEGGYQPDVNWISIIITIVMEGTYLRFNIRTLRLWFRLSLKKNQLVPEFPCWLQEENQNPDLGSKSTLQNIGKVSQNCATKSMAAAFTMTPWKAVEIQVTFTSFMINIMQRTPQSRVLVMESICKGRCQKRFSGFGPLRGGGTPPFR